MARASRTFAGAGADLDAGKRRVELAVKGAAPLFFPDYFVCGQVEGNGSARMTDGDPRARSSIQSNSLVEAWPGSASPS